MKQDNNNSRAEGVFHFPALFRLGFLPSETIVGTSAPINPLSFLRRNF